MAFKLKEPERQGMGGLPKLDILSRLESFIPFGRTGEAGE